MQGEVIVANKAAKRMNTKLVSSISLLSHSRLQTISPQASLVDAAILLSRTQISLVVVCVAEGSMVGVITKTDIVCRIGQCREDAWTTPVADMMSREVTSCRPSDSLPELLSTMHRCGLVHVPVVDENRKPLGVVNARDALRALLAEEEYEESLLRDYVMGVGYR